MGSYLLMFYVTVQQEKAVRQLFVDRGWQFVKEGAVKNRKMLYADRSSKDKVVTPCDQIASYQLKKLPFLKHKEKSRTFTNDTKKLCNPKENTMVLNHRPNNHSKKTHEEKEMTSLDSCTENEEEKNLPTARTHNDINNCSAVDLICSTSLELSEKVHRDEVCTMQDFGPSVVSDYSRKKSSTNENETTDKERDSGYISACMENMDKNCQRLSVNCETKSILGVEEQSQVVLDKNIEKMSESNELSIMSRMSKLRKLDYLSDARNLYENRHLSSSLIINHNTENSSQTHSEIYCLTTKGRQKESGYKQDNAMQSLNENTVKNRSLDTENYNAFNEAKRKSFTCSECNVEFKRQKIHDNHKLNGKCRFECSFCARMFTASTYSDYKRHICYHTKEKPHKCDVCVKSFMYPKELRTHMLKHQGQRPFICDKCGRRFFSYFIMLNHLKVMHSDSPKLYQCEFCGYSSRHQGCLVTHKTLVHPEGSSIDCPICGKKFKSKLHFKYHLPTHGEESFKCEICGKGFKRRQGLTNHQRRHKKDYHYFCTNCDKGFYEKTTLRAHIRTHSGEKPYVCEVCGYRCAIKSNLSKHMAVHSKKICARQEVPQHV
ncbi:hypothetical protein CHS0354_041250 [Potamilus streckersoni]|uniref:C2H2-type domain-containing protein n=1 Tax=Potamilus streckersoni TaxID=2493646 RepID=A0AAE0SEF8_9BIVA|nr:hypothetical protein CHS0354_041250 [Potamilus streckersoni]